MRLALAALFAACALPAAALAQTAPAPAPAYPRTIPTPGGEVIIPSAGYQKAYDDYGYAPARRVGDTLYISGAAAGRREGEGTDAAAFEAQVRRAFVQLDRVLKASGATFDDVVILNSFHVWDGPDVTLPREEQFAIINKVKAEYIKGPHPAWTAVGTTGLLAPRGVIEIQAIAHAPKRG
jgi:enamine deaminase RidA (YjgF/YER057c/UK114 family)